MPRHPILVPLSHDHREALGLTFFLHHPAPPGRVTAMTPTSTPERRRARLLAFYDTYLVSHFRAEEEALFPALRTRRALVASLCDVGKDSATPITSSPCAGLPKIGSRLSGIWTSCPDRRLIG